MLSAGGMFIAGAEATGDHNRLWRAEVELGGAKRKRKGEEVEEEGRRERERESWPAGFQEKMG